MSQAESSATDNILELYSLKEKNIFMLLWYKQILRETKANNNINNSYSTYWVITFARQRDRDF